MAALKLVIVSASVAAAARIITWWSFTPIYSPTLGIIKSLMSLSQGKIQHLRALSNKDGVIAAAAMDQRGSLQKSIAAVKSVDKKDVTDEVMHEFKDRKSTRLNSSHLVISYAVFCLKK